MSTSSIYVTICVGLVVCLYYADGNMISNIPAGYAVKAVDNYDCRWICAGNGEFVECAQTEIAVGTCGSGDFAQCSDRKCQDNDRYFTAIQCCKVRVTAVKSATN